MKQCSKCKLQVDAKFFSCTKKNLDGTCKYFASQCNSCRVIGNRKSTGAKEKPKPYVDNTSKECLKCHIVLPNENFSDSKRGRNGKSSYCRPCANEYFRPSKEYGRIYTQRYRDKHRLHWRQLHRLNMFYRRHKIKVISDGSVTKDFLEYVYNIEHCYWCNEVINFESRTLEHIKELSNGGLHSIFNLTMACIGCNSSRKNRNDEHHGEGCGRQYINDRESYNNL